MKTIYLRFCPVIPEYMLNSIVREGEPAGSGARESAQLTLDQMHELSTARKGVPFRKVIPPSKERLRHVFDARNSHTLFQTPRQSQYA